MTNQGAPGARNSLTDVAGLLVGSAEDGVVKTGVTVITPKQGAFACAVDVRGGGPGTRETDALLAHTLVDAVHAVVLSGGSVYGLASADGVAAALGARGEGFGLVDTPGVPKSPVIPAAILYDLANGGDKSWGETPPYRALGVQALANAGETIALGPHGAGRGARAGSGPGGLGSASWVTQDGMTVAALVAVNSFGAVRMPGSQAFWAWPFEQTWQGELEFGGARPTSAGGAAWLHSLDDWGPAKANPAPRENTTIAAVATDVPLGPGDLQRLAIMAQDGLARAIRPVHAPFDGDVVFAISTGAAPEETGLGAAARGDVLARAMRVARLGSLAADTLARAVARGVHASERAAQSG